MTRKQAKALGLKQYFTGVPCRHGHVMERRVDNRTCVGCKLAMTMNWFAANPDSKAASDRRYRATHQDKLSLYYKRWRTSNPDKFAANIKKWQASNRGYGAAKSRNYQAKKRGNGGAHTHQDILDLLQAQGHQCAYFDYCGTALTPKNRHVDHIIAISKGGSNGPDNLQILCGSCNRRKSAKDHVMFCQELGISPRTGH